MFISDGNLTSKINNFSEYFSDFTNLFNIQDRTYLNDSTFINHIELIGDVTSFIDVSNELKSTLIGSHFDQSFIIFNENILANSMDNITSYYVPV